MREIEVFVSTDFSSLETRFETDSKSIITFLQNPPQDPDVIHLVDPIWLGGQTLMGLELGWAGEKWVGEKGPGVGGGLRGAVVGSYHT